MYINPFKYNIYDREYTQKEIYDIINTSPFAFLRNPCDIDMTKS